MKKILYMLLCLFLLVGCTHQSSDNTGISSSTTTDPVVTTTTPAVTTTSNKNLSLSPSLEEIIASIDKESIINFIFNDDFIPKTRNINIYSAIPETWTLWDEIDLKYNGYHPGGIEIFPDEKIITWNIDQRTILDSNGNPKVVYHITENDKEVMKNVLDYNIYKGILTPITDTIFASTGIFIPSIEENCNKISDKIDFYIKIDNNRLYIIMNDLTVEELLSYNHDYYFNASSTIKKEE